MPQTSATSSTSADASRNGSSDGNGPMPWAQRKAVALGRFPAECPRFSGYFMGAGSTLKQCPAQAVDHLSRAHPEQLDVHTYGVYKHMGQASYRKRK